MVAWEIAKEGIPDMDLDNEGQTRFPEGKLGHIDHQRSHPTTIYHCFFSNQMLEKVVSVHLQQKSQAI